MSPFMRMAVFNSISYTIGWFWSVLLGIDGHPYLAVFGVGILVVLQLYYTKRIDPLLYIKDLILVLFSIPAGIFLEILFIQIGTIQYANHHFFPPLWIIALYPLFVLLLNHSLVIVKKSLLLAFLFGFFGAPFSYWSGAALGGLTISQSILISWIVLGTGWGIFLCFFRNFTFTVERAANETFEDSQDKNALELLYDGDCPICKREICMLQKRDAKNVAFVDIASKDYLASDHHHIDYSKAMNQMHAVDSSGNVLAGLDAFASVYARCRLTIIATLLRIPFIRFFLKPLYALFAKNRLLITGRYKRK